MKSHLVVAKGKLSKMKVTKLAENTFSNIFYVMVLLPFPFLLPLPSHFFNVQAIENTIDLYLFCVVFAYKKNSKQPSKSYKIITLNFFSLYSEITQLNC